MSKINTLHISQGALSVYRKKLFDLYGGFDEHNITEDLEIAMRFKFHGHTIKLASESVSYTHVPNTFQGLWNQRVRWFRGFLQNTIKYKKMMMNKKYGLMGTFQYPLNVISISVVLLMFVLLSFTFGKTLYQSLLKFRALGLEYFSFSLPSLQDMLLSINVTLFFPLTIAFLVGLFIYHLAHKSLKEKWQFPLALAAYMTVYPVLKGCHWVTALCKELVRARKKW